MENTTDDTAVQLESGQVTQQSLEMAEDNTASRPSGCMQWCAKLRSGSGHRVQPISAPIHDQVTTVVGNIPNSKI